MSILKARFWSAWASGFCISNKLPGEAHVAGPQNTLWAARMSPPVPERKPRLWWERESQELTFVLVANVPWDSRAGLTTDPRSPASKHMMAHDRTDSEGLVTKSIESWLSYLIRHQKREMSCRGSTALCTATCVGHNLTRCHSKFRPRTSKYPVPLTSTRKLFQFNWPHSSGLSCLNFGRRRGIGNIPATTTISTMTATTSTADGPHVFNT